MNGFESETGPGHLPACFKCFLVSRLSWPSEASWDLNPSSNPKPLNPEKDP